MESPKKIRAIEDSAPLEDGVAPAIEDGAPLEDAKDDKEDDKEPVDKLGAFSNFATLRPEDIQVALDRVIEVYGNPKTPKKKDQLHNRDTRAFSFCGTHDACQILKGGDVAFSQKKKKKSDKSSAELQQLSYSQKPTEGAKQLGGSTETRRCYALFALQ